MKKNKFSIVLLLIIIILAAFSSAEAYYKPEEYRKSLLAIRDVERILDKLEADLNQAQNTFRIIPGDKITSELAVIDNSYQKMINSYQNQNDSDVELEARKISARGKKLRLEIIESKPVQLRAFWLDSGTFAELKGRAGVEAFLDLAAEANFNAIFPETFYKGMTVVPTSELMVQDPGFKSWQEDPLQVLIEAAEKRGIEVHAWVWVFNENTAGKPGRILRENPDWANKNKAGEIVSYHNSSWLSPANSEVKKYLQQRYQYLVKNYDLDGINLDYIRFPEEFRGSFGYDNSTVEAFKDKHNLDPFKIESGSRDAALWNQFRENLITEMVRESAEIMRQLDPELLISADVIPGREEARFRALQNWSLWLEEGYLDFVLPMTYTENLFSELSSWIKEDREIIKKPLYAGISVFKLSSAQVVEQMREINKINPNGFSLFAAAHLKKEDFESLAAGIFSKKAVLPHQNRKESLAEMQDFILQRLNIIKEAGKINNDDLIKIRRFLNQKVSLETDTSNAEQGLTLSQFSAANNLNISADVMEILVSDFNYLDNIIKLY
ncbi:glycoside hydrolase family 10 protein [Halanaerobium saccharolyticum]|uniref:glycoside hydrolase family 10 protein n=1 Tax=Halanaerobium saccharolyticum TaxID=43595 RepID=UPI003FCDA151